MRTVHHRYSKLTHFHRYNLWKMCKMCILSIHTKWKQINCIFICMSQLSIERRERRHDEVWEMGNRYCSITVWFTVLPMGAIYKSIWSLWLAAYTMHFYNTIKIYFYSLRFCFMWLWIFETAHSRMRKANVSSINAVIIPI